MTTTQTPNLNHAAARLIEALDDMEAVDGFRVGLQRTIRFTEAAADPNNSAHHEALDAAAVWEALDELAAAVAVRKENHDG